MPVSRTPPTPAQQHEMLNYEGRRDLSDRATCLGCGYALCGLPENRCPECGRAFDPFDATTMRLPGVRPPPKPVPFAVEMIIAAVIAAGFTTASLVAPVAPLCVLAAVIWIGIFIAWRKRNAKERAAVTRGETLEGTRHWRVAVLVLFVLS